MRSISIASRAEPQPDPEPEPWSELGVALDEITRELDERATRLERLLAGAKVVDLEEVRKARAQRPAEEVSVTVAQLFDVGGEKLTKQQIAERIGATPQAIDMRIKKGWPHDALLAPAGTRLADVMREAGVEAPAPKRRRASPPHARSRASEGDAVRELLTGLRPAELLSRLGYTAAALGDAREHLVSLGYTVDDLGEHPNGRLMLVRGGDTT